MASRELPSGFDFLSFVHFRMAVMHLAIKFGADIFIQPRVIDIFHKLKMAAAAILDLLGEPWDHPRRLIRGACHLKTFCHDRLSSFQVFSVVFVPVPNLVQTSLIVTEIEALMLQTYSS